MGQLCSLEKACAAQNEQHAGREGAAPSSRIQNKACMRFVGDSFADGTMFPRRKLARFSTLINNKNQNNENNRKKNDRMSNKIL